MAINDKHFCTCMGEGITSDAGHNLLAGHKGALLLASKWEVGTSVSIRFLDGDDQLQQRVRDVAREWMDVANISLNFQEGGATDIRIAFEQGNGSWSYLGTMCRQIPEPQPTMNFGWLTPDSADDELRRVVLHEFGHALGLIHEHQNPKDGGIDWNTDAVIHDLSGPPNNWSPATIEENMFKKYEQNALLMTNVDKESIMMYPIPLSWTLDQTSVGLNNTLSPLDKELIGQAYPR
ncbi:M12 family metallopeptidase [Pseudomonas izuensis]|uniref:M12 family metallopeptidase n=1 Tax=Pseudomonas izuensis TaxID=2684212 RepID=UPI001C4992EC|nr:M12 family metallopeptidase [Pseudomonas izuensis]